MKNVLVISAHPDDLEIGCGGTVSKLVAEGATVINLIMYPDVDHLEYLHQSQELLGFTPILFRADTRPTINNITIAEVEMLLSDFKPDLIITHWKEDWHQDHRACHELGNILARRQPVDLWYMSSYPYHLKYKEFNPNLYMKLSWDYAEPKYDAITGYLNLTPRWVDAISSHDAWRGSMVSDGEQAEVFMIGHQNL